MGWWGGGEGGAEQYTEVIKRREKPCQNGGIVGIRFPSPQVRKRADVAEVRRPFCLRRRLHSRQVR